MKVGEVCNRTVVVSYKSEMLAEAARLMREHHVGSLVVVQDSVQGRVPVGMITDRDIVVAVVAKDVDPRTIAVGEAMSSEPATVREDDSVMDALRVMRQKGVRRVPVVGRDGALIGILTVDDLLDIVAEQLHELVRAVGSERVREQQRRA